MGSAASLLTVKTHPSSLALAAVIVGCGVIRAYYSRKLAPVAPKVVKRQATGLERAVLPVVFLGDCLISCMYIFTRLLDFANFASPDGRVWVTAAGGLTAALALWLFARSHSDLGNMWSVTLELREKHKLITSGLYAHVRHPMYMSIILMYAGKAILVPNLVVIAGELAAMAALAFIRVPKEERMMIEEFGEEYQRYMAAVGGIVPKLKIWPQKRRGGEHTS